MSCAGSACAPGCSASTPRRPEEVGAILAQDPPAGAAAARNSVITLYVGAAPHDPALSEPPADRQPPDTATGAARSRRRRKPGHGHALNAMPATLGGAVHAERDAEPMAAEIYRDGEAGAARPDALEAGDVEFVGREDLAPAGQRVHHDALPPTVSTPVEAGGGPAGSASALDERALLTPLSGLPRAFALKRWQRVPRRARLAITSGLVCVAALLALALIEHHQPSPQHAASASRQVARPTVKRPTGGARSSSRSRRHQHSRTPTYSPTRHASHPAGPARPPRSSTRAPEPSPTVMSPPVTSPAAPAVPAPAAPADQAPEPSVSVVGGVVAVDGQIPGGPFSP